MTTSDDSGASSSAPPTERRVIKRYSNRKLYDTKGSSYVTLLQIAEIIRSGEDVEIIDNATKEDKTDVTLALIISEELRSRPRAIPLATLKALIRHRGERILTQLRDGPIGKLIPVEGNRREVRESPEAGPSAPESVDRSVEDGRRTQGDEDMTQAKEGRGLRATLEQWQAAIDERVRALAPNPSAFRQLEEEVRRLADRIESLERRLQDPADRSGNATDGRRDGG